MAPDVAVEIVSPSDRPEHRAHKIDVYLRSGAAAVVEIDPLGRTVRVIERSGERELTEDDCFEHEALPGFSLPLTELFAELHP